MRDTKAAAMLMKTKTNEPATITSPILVTGAAGKVGSVGFKIVELLRGKGIPVRAMVRREDDRSEALAKLGAEIVQGDLTDLCDVRRIMDGCKRLYFGMSASSSYLEATVNTAAVAKHYLIMSNYQPKEFSPLCKGG